MTRGWAVVLIASALAAGLALRFASLDARPMHHDEANQAVKFGALLERGEYLYDAHDHHGPTLYYLTLPVAALRGQWTLAALDERTLRAVTAAFGAATIALIPLAAPAAGRTAAVAAAWLMALSPAMVFYSRMFIQEALLTCFTLAFIASAGRAAMGGRLSWSLMAGVAAGLALATKETSVIVLPAALVSCAIALWSVHGTRDVEADREDQGAGVRWATRSRWSMAVLVSAGSAAVVAALFYSSFLTAPEGVLAPFAAARTYVDRGIAPSSHVHPWHYYLGLLWYSGSGGLRWSEAPVLVLAVAGVVVAWRRPGAAEGRDAFWWRYLTLYTAITAVIFSTISYKTPWNLLPFYAGAVVVAGWGFQALVHSRRSSLLGAALVAAFIAAAGHLGWQAWRASIVYAADDRNPYVYAQTVPDAVRMVGRIRDLARLHPDGAAMQVSVIAPPHEQWPLPWYLRAMPNVGYWTAAGDPLALQAPVLVSSLDQTDALDRALSDTYVSEFYGLRPDVLLTLYIERGLWERFLAAASGAGPSP